LELAKRLDRPSFELLRWIILSNRAHLASLPDELALPFRNCRQFMAVLSEPEAEDVFQKLKGQYRSRLLWHGSGMDRWHSIVRNGLKNATGTSLMAHGSACGAGIYFAADSGTSLGYISAGNNKYAASELRNPLSMMALCEVAQVPSKSKDVPVTRSDGVVVTCKGFVKNHKGYGSAIVTCTMEEAVVVRILFVGDLSYGLEGAMPQKLPSLREVLEYQSAH
jgi:poly [ADP-ribose] polymerase 6/8